MDLTDVSSLYIQRGLLIHGMDSETLEMEWVTRMWYTITDPVFHVSRNVQDIIGSRLDS